MVSSSAPLPAALYEVGFFSAAATARAGFAEAGLRAREGAPVRSFSGGPSDAAAGGLAGDADPDSGDFETVGGTGSEVGGTEAEVVGCASG